jgi:hypothetical protein
VGQLPVLARPLLREPADELRFPAGSAWVWLEADELNVAAPNGTTRTIAATNTRRQARDDLRRLVAPRGGACE